MSARIRFIAPVVLAGLLSCHGPAERAQPSALVRPAADADPSGLWELRWDRTFAAWDPPVFEGTLSLRREGDRWTGEIFFQQVSATATVQSVQIAGNQIEALFRWDEPVPAPPLAFSGWLREGRLIGEMRAGPVPWTPAGGRRLALPKMLPGHVDHSLPVSAAEGSGVAPAALRTLLDRAEAEYSSALVVLKDGKVVVEAYREGEHRSPLVAMSASKSIASLAVGMLIADGKLSLDTTMGSLFPEWSPPDPRSAITVRQLLTHTSGLDPVSADVTKGGTIREGVLHAKLVSPPGTSFRYNNSAVDFLAVVFQRASGVAMDEYLQRRLFRKLDMVGAHWTKDREGTPFADGSLFVRPVDLAKLGQLMLDGGEWNGERIVPREWIERSVEPGQTFDESCGFLWWRLGRFAPTLLEPVLQAWRDEGVDDAGLNGARALIGRKFTDEGEYWRAIQSAVGAETYSKILGAIDRGNHVPISGHAGDGPVNGFYAAGWMGQYLVALPAARVVAVRMRAPEGVDYENLHTERYGYSSFAEDVERLLR